MDDIKGLLEKMVICDLTKEEQIEFDKVMSDYMKSGNRDLYDIWLAPKMIRLESKFKMDALKKVLEKKYYQYYCNLIEDITADDAAGVLPVISKMKIKEDKEEMIKNSDYVFLTICPAKGAGVFEIIKYVDRFVKLKFVKQYLYVLEQRYCENSEDKINTKLGDGLHVHILLKKDNYKRNFIIRDVKRVFGTMTINLDFKYIKDSDLMKCQNYMIGTKKDESKQIKQEFDKRFRQEVGIRDYYGQLYE